MSSLRKLFAIKVSDSGDVRSVEWLHRGSMFPNVLRDPSQPILGLLHGHPWRPFHSDRPCNSIGCLALHRLSSRSPAQRRAMNRPFDGTPLSLRMKSM